MKKNLFYLFALICSMSLFAACSDDDDVTTDPDDPTTGTDLATIISGSIAGNYKGDLVVSLAGIEIGNLSQQISIEKGDGESVSLSITDFSIIGMELGDINLEDCPVTEEADGSYSFTGNASMTLLGGTLTAEVSGEGSFTVASTTSMSLNLDIAAVLSGIEQDVAVEFTGTRLTGSEGTEADILSFTFSEDIVATQPVIDGTTITFNVLEGVDVTSLTPTIEVSAGATVTPASGEAQDFSSPVTYTVVSEDYGTTKTYTVSVSGTSIYYSFENWTPYQEGSESGFYNPTGWSSSNMGAMYLMLFSLVDSYVVMETDDAYSGEKAALITTLDSQGMSLGSYMIPKITTGSLFLGDFVVDLTNTLNSTKFGIPFTRVPVSLKGWYKYTPGDEYYSVTEEPYVDHCHEAVLDETKTDECMISVVLYETSEYDETGYSDCLTGVEGENNIYTSDRVVAIGQLTDGAQAEWTEFELPLEWKADYDADKLYRLAIICSASKDGDKFSGAPGSTLIVDNFELVCE